MRNVGKEERRIGELQRLSDALSAKMTEKNEAGTFRSCSRLNRIYVFLF